MMLVIKVSSGMHRGVFWGEFRKVVLNLVQNYAQILKKICNKS